MNHKTRPFLAKISLHQSTNGFNSQSKQFNSIDRIESNQIDTKHARKRKRIETVRDCLKYRFHSVWLVHMCQKKSLFLFPLSVLFHQPLDTPIARLGILDSPLLSSLLLDFFFSSFHIVSSFLWIGKFGQFRISRKSDYHFTSMFNYLATYWFRWFSSDSSHIERRWR